MLALLVPSLLAISEGLTSDSLSFGGPSPNGRHTPLIAALSLGFGDALPLALKHGPRSAYPTAPNASGPVGCPLSTPSGLRRSPILCYPDQLIRFVAKPGYTLRSMRTTKPGTGHDTPNQAEHRLLPCR
jgi:hypothetical protein